MFKRVCMQARDATSLLHHHQFSPSLINASSPYTHTLRTQTIHTHTTHLTMYAHNTTRTRTLARGHSDIQLLRPLQLPGGVEHTEVGMLR